jgi:FAD/FMN-containing dehydrogenase
MTGSGNPPPFFRGEWLERGQPAYEEARPVFNRRIDPRPAVIARCAGTADVLAAVGRARERGLRLDVRSSGYGIGGENSGDGLVVDLSLMRGVQVLPDRRVARIQGGARGGDLQIEAALHGLGAGTGVLSGSGVGLLLGGGLGYLSSRIGWASENVLVVELVTAAGELVTASPDVNPDLFWAVRGAPGSFGVVTALEMRLHEIPPLVHAASVTWSVNSIAGPIEALRTLPDWASEDLSLISILNSAALDGHGGYELFACHTGPAGQARADLDRLCSSSTPDVKAVNEIPFRDLHFVNDELFPPMRVIIDEQPLRALDDELIETLVARIREPADGAMRFVEVSPRFGAFGRAPEFPSVLREAAEPPTWSLGPGCWWDDGSEDADHAEWTRQVMADIRRIGPAEGGMHPNSVGIAVDDEGLERMYGDRLPRLRELKRRWDPENVFSGTHEIPPAES